MFFKFSYKNSADGSGILTGIYAYMAGGVRGSENTLTYYVNGPYVPYLKQRTSFMLTNVLSCSKRL